MTVDAPDLARSGDAREDRRDLVDGEQDRRGGGARLLDATDETVTVDDGHVRSYAVARPRIDSCGPLEAEAAADARHSRGDSRVSAALSETVELVELGDAVLVELAEPELQT